MGLSYVYGSLVLLNGGYSMNYDVHIRYKVIDDKSGVVLGAVLFDGRVNVFVEKKNLVAGKYRNATVTSDKKVMGSVQVIKYGELQCIINGNTGNNIMELYHGSHSGIVGSISPSSRGRCDFGSGFYTGDNLFSAKSWVSSDTDGTVYKLSVNFDGLNVYSFTDDVLWALYIAYNRGKIGKSKYPKLRRIAEEINSYDVVIGTIADDKMMTAYTEFTRNNLTDVCLVESLKCVKLGNQYVFKTRKACSKIKVVNKHKLAFDEKRKLKKAKLEQSNRLAEMLDDIAIKYKRTGNYMVEVLRGYK